MPKKFENNHLSPSSGQLLPPPPPDGLGLGGNLGYLKDPAEKTIIYPCRPPENPFYYARRVQDPLPIGVGFRDDLEEALNSSLVAIDGRKITQNQRLELETDIVYRTYQLGQHDELKMRADTARALAERMATERGLSYEGLGYSMRALDIRTVLAFIEHSLTVKQAGPKEERDEEAKNMVKISTQMLEATLTEINKDGVDLLERYQPEFAVLNGKKNLTKEQEKLRKAYLGKLFELFYVESQRIGMVEEDKFIVGATHFEDASATDYPENSHNYDVLVLNLDGSCAGLVQCKAGRSNKVYKKPIVKVEGNDFYDFLDNPGGFIAGFREIIENSGDSDESRMSELVRGIGRTAGDG